MLQNYLLELSGTPAGRFGMMTGGTVQAEIVEVAQRGGPTRKHISSVRVEDMVFTCGTGMSRTFYDWIGSSFEGKTQRMSGAVVRLGESNKPISRLEFADALVKSVSLPALARSQNLEAEMLVKISPEIVRTGKVETAQKLGVYTAALQKPWMISDFKLSISGLESASVQVTNVGALNFGMDMKPNSTGGRFEEKIPGAIKYSDLEIQVPGIYADAFRDWFDDFVIKGNNSPVNERNGLLEFYAPNSSKPYFEVVLEGLGIYKMDGESSPKSPGRNLPKSSGLLKLSLYCESMKFRAGSAAIA